MPDGISAAERLHQFLCHDNIFMFFSFSIPLIPYTAHCDSVMKISNFLFPSQKLADAFRPHKAPEKRDPEQKHYRVCGEQPAQKTDGERCRDIGDIMDLKIHSGKAHCNGDKEKKPGNIFSEAEKHRRRECHCRRSMPRRERISAGRQAARIRPICMKDGRFVCKRARAHKNVFQQRFRNQHACRQRDQRRATRFPRSPEGEHDEGNRNKGGAAVPGCAHRSEKRRKKAPALLFCCVSKRRKPHIDLKYPIHFLSPNKKFGFIIAELF